MKLIKPTGSRFNERLKRLRKSYDTEIQLLAIELRTSIIVPICKKHRLDFTQGPWAFYFSREVPGKSAESLNPMCEATAAKRKGLPLERVFKMLNLEVEPNLRLGDFVENVRFADLGVSE